MQLVPSLLFGVSASLDALLVGVSYGVRGVRIRLWQNTFISLVTLLGTCLSISFGSILIPLVPPLISSCAGSLILSILGIYYIVKWLFSFAGQQEPGHLSDQKQSALKTAEQPLDCLSTAEVLFLSLSLSVNNLGIGLSASLTGLTLIPAAVATCLCSVLFLLAGNLLGQSRLLRLIGDLADPISGLLLIGLSLIQLFL